MRSIKVLLPSSEIPLGASVSKATGRAVYVLKDRLRIFGPEDRKEVVADEGARFLVSEGDANVVAGAKELIWHTDEDELEGWLATRRMEREGA